MTYNTNFYLHGLIEAVLQCLLHSEYSMLNCLSPGREKRETAEASGISLAKTSNMAKPEVNNVGSKILHRKGLNTS